LSSCTISGSSRRAELRKYVSKEVIDHDFLTPCKPLDPCVEWGELKQSANLGGNVFFLFLALVEDVVDLSARQMVVTYPSRTQEHTIIKACEQYLSELI
jgi:hypothetical protein